MQGMSRRPVILSYARTPFGRFQGGLSGLPATDLGGHAIAAALDRAGIDPARVDHVIMGQVLQAGAGQVPSRQAAVKAGIPFEVTTETLNKVCASGHRAVTLAATMIRASEHEVIIAGGMESMSRAPHLLFDLRGGRRMGDDTLVDAMIYDGLTDPFTHKHMVVSGSDVAEELGITRESQDEWAYRSHQRAVAAEGKLAAEIVPVSIASRKGETVIDIDEAPRADTTLEKLASLKPVMTKDGTTTAGNAPGVNDGAAALVISSNEWAQREGIEPIAFVRGHAYVATDSPYLAKTPGMAINKLLEREGLTHEDIARFEINEAFASVTLHSSSMVGMDPEKVNVNGGAVALGHPIGASGARIIGSLALELQRIGGGLGIAAICSGGGQGDAVLIEVPTQ
jgi:acetyl-CoA C-acetyltransferase